MADKDVSISGGVTIDSGQNTSVGGDLVGRDRVSQDVNINGADNVTTIHALQGNLIVNYLGANSEQPIQISKPSEKLSTLLPNIDLTEYCFTFPENLLTPAVPLDSKVREIRDKFSASNPCIILQGPSGSGKTVHLAQFAKSFPSNSFCYFITDNIWNKQPLTFLSNLCHQMKVLLGRNNEPDTINADVDQLRNIFANLSQKVIEIARREKTAFYFVIDGLDLACQGTPGERIIDLFPLPTSPKGLYLLGSMRSPTSSQIRFSHLIEKPHQFSKIETEKYLEDLTLDPDEVSHIQNTIEGMPGYLAILRKLYKEKNIPITQILEASTSEIESLLEIQWNASGAESTLTHKRILALIAYSLSPLRFCRSIIFRFCVRVSAARSYSSNVARHGAASS